MCKICTLLSYGLCGAIRWPLTRARAALTQQGNTLRLPCYAQHFLSSFRRGRCLHRPARETRRVAGHVGPVLHSVALPEPGGQGRPLLQGERIPTPVCALARNDRVNFPGVSLRDQRERWRGNPYSLRDNPSGASRHLPLHRGGFFSWLPGSPAQGEIAAGGAAAISRKCPDWRPRQWPGIGWHNGGQAVSHKAN